LGGGRGAKARPGTLNCGSASIGTANQLDAERSGIGALHVRFKGAPENLTELLAGRLDFFCPADICLPHIQDGRLVALAMGSSKRSTVLSNLQTTVELVVPDPNYDFWVGMFMPTATPRDIVDKLDHETAKANPEVKESLGKPGAEQNLMDPLVFDSEIKKEIATNAALVKAAGIPIRSR
jgi:tripartite-type tricarboxylate transporter receptor subunit TctC